MWNRACVNESDNPPKFRKPPPRHPPGRQRSPSWSKHVSSTQQVGTHMEARGANIEMRHTQNESKVDVWIWHRGATKMDPPWMPTCCVLIRRHIKPKQTCRDQLDNTGHWFSGPTPRQSIRPQGTRYALPLGSALQPLLPGLAAAWRATRKQFILVSLNRVVGNNA